jgi:diguanylate cyclase (GGDEF)-like protein
LIKIKIIMLIIIMLFSNNILSKEFSKYIEDYKDYFLINYDNEATHKLMKEIEDNLSKINEESISTQLTIREMFSEYSYYFGDLDKLDYHSQKGKDLSLKNNNQRLEVFYYYRAVYHNLNGNKTDITLENFNKAVKYALLTENNEILFNTYIELGELYSFLNNVNQAFKYYQKAENHATKQSDYIYVILGISSIFYYLELDEFTLEYLEKAKNEINMSEKLSIPKEDFYINIYSSYSAIYEENKNYELSEEYLNKYIKIALFQNDENFIALGYIKAVLLFLKKEELEKAIFYLEKLKYIFKKHEKNMLFDTIYNYHLTEYNYFLHIGEYEKAKKKLIILENKFSNNDKEIYKTLSKEFSIINKKLGNFDEALRYQKEFNELYISSRSEKETTLGFFLNESYKDKELILERKRLNKFNLKKQIELLSVSENNIEKDKKIIRISIIIMLVLTIILILIYLYVQKKIISEKSDLVDCYNRRFAVKKINNLISKNKLFNVFLFDIDYFKSINDNYGHDIGDKILIEFSDLVKIYISKNSYLCRVGGEEFMIIEEYNEDLINIEEIRNKIKKHEFKNLKKQTKITASFGCYKQSKYKAICDFDKIYKILDEKLYKAKNEGRDKVIY